MPAGLTIMWPWATRTPCDYCSCGVDGHITTTGTYRVQSRPSPAPARPAPCHPEQVTDEPPTAAIQDRRAPDPACLVLYPPTGREPLDTAPVWADSPAHRATRGASDLSGSTAPGASAMRSGGRTGGGVSGRRDRSQHIQTKGGDLEPYFTRKTSVNDVGKGDRADRGMGRSFGTNEGTELGPDRKSRVSASVAHTAVKQA